MARFSIFSEHGEALARIAEDPRARMSDIADALGVSERKVRRLVADLVDNGYIARQREGRLITLTPTSAELAAGLLAVRSVGIDTTAPAEPTKRDEIRSRLGMAVEQLLAHEGSFAGLSVEDLIQTAGFSRSTFYAYFRDKDDLLLALVADVLDELSEASRGWADLGPDLTKEDLRAALVRIGKVHRPHRLLMAAAAHADPAHASVRMQYDELLQRSRQLIEDHIVRGQREGFVADDVDAASTAALLMWGMELRLNELPIDTSEAKLTRVLDALTDLAWNVLYADAQLVTA